MHTAHGRPQRKGHRQQDGSESANDIEQHDFIYSDPRVGTPAVIESPTVDWILILI